MQRHLVIFAKAPRLGLVKRRLAAEIGPLAAWRFYWTTMASVLRPLARDPRWRCWLAVTPEPARWPVGASMGVARLPQGRGDLGRRMDRVMRVLPPGPAVIIGTDIPDIRPRHAAAAFRALGRHDAVFGPAADGGYWLVGLRRRPTIPRAFDGVRWSTEHALADTLANLRPRFSCDFLETLVDVDDAAALHRA